MKLNCIPSFRLLAFMFALGILLVTTATFAHEAADGRVQVSGGIASPSTSSAVHTNPAGLSDAKTSFVLQAGAPEVWDNGTYRAGLQTGESNFGGAAGVELDDQANHSPFVAYYGLGVRVQSLSFGIAGRTGLSNSNGSTFNLGALFPAGSNARIGLTARGLQDGIIERGFGVDFGLASWLDFVVDAATDSNLSHPELKPGFKISGESVGLTVSYGTGARQQFADGFTAGASLDLSSGSQLEFQYNAGGPLSKYFASFTRPF